MDTIWGISQSEKQIAEGITHYTTASHGGYKLSPERLDEMPESFRFKDGWYEEDCAACVVILCFPDVFKEEITYKNDEAGIEQVFDMIRKTVKNYFPDEYEKAYNVVLAPGESTDKDMRLFLESHKEDYLCISASNIPNDPDHVLVTGQKNYGFLQFGEIPDEKEAIVPKKDYIANLNSGIFPFIIP